VPSDVGRERYREGSFKWVGEAQGYWFSCNKGLFGVELSTSLILIKPACEGFTNHKGLGEFLFLIFACDTWMYNGEKHGYI
jgi:hypothetical protein